MKKLLVLLILILIGQVSFCDEIKNYYMQKDILYVLVFPDDVLQLKIEGEGKIDFSVNTDIENTKQYVSLFTNENSQLKIDLKTADKNFVYNISSTEKNIDNCDKDFYKVDIPPAPPKTKEEEINTESVSPDVVVNSKEQK